MIFKEKALVSMTKYKCWFPLCEYETDSRSKIDFHHVTPREIDPRSKITVPLCKTCHALIFHPEAKAGQHSINSDRSMQILGIYKSTAGESIHYMKADGTKIYYFPRDKTIWND
jgi:hypothetical protein